VSTRGTLLLVENRLWTWRVRPSSPGSRRGVAPTRLLQGPDSAGAGSGRSIACDSWLTSPAARCPSRARAGQPSPKRESKRTSGGLAGGRGRGRGTAWKASNLAALPSLFLIQAPLCRCRRRRTLPACLCARSNAQHSPTHFYFPFAPPSFRRQLSFCFLFSPLFSIVRKIDTYWTRQRHAATTLSELIKSRTKGLLSNRI